MNYSTLTNKRGSMELVLAVIVALLMVGAGVYFYTAHQPTASVHIAAKTPAVSQTPVEIKSDTDALQVETAVNSAKSSDISDDEPADSDLGL